MCNKPEQQQQSLQTDNPENNPSTSWVTVHTMNPPCGRTRKPLNCLSLCHEYSDLSINAQANQVNFKFSIFQFTVADSTLSTTPGLFLFHAPPGGKGSLSQRTHLFAILKIGIPLSLV